MPTLIRGDRLSSETRAEVLSAFGYRWTVENEERSLRWRVPIGRTKRSWRRPQPPLLTDAEWLRAHAFHVNRDGRLARRPARCENADWAPTPACSCCGFVFRGEDTANPIPSSDRFLCGVCLFSTDTCCRKAVARCQGS